MKSFVVLSLSVALAAALGGCASSSPDVIQRGDAQHMAKVEDGIVLSVRPVRVDGSQSGVGAAVGGVVGAIGGYNASGVQREGQVLGVLAAVGGAAAGNAIERFATKEDAFEILIQLKNGERRAVVQAKGTDVFAAGDSVIIITTGNKVRVSKAPAMPPPAATAAPSPVTHADQSGGIPQPVNALQPAQPLN
jgi:outer membrane lipoprotein SlyB